MKTQDLNELAKTVHQANIKWWQNLETGEPIARNKEELLALVVSEVSECLEGERKGSMDDKLPHRRMAEVEMADALIRLLDFAAGFGLRLTVVPFLIPISDNKGETLFRIMKMITDSFQGVLREVDEFKLSGCIAYIKAYCNKHGYDLEGAFSEKMAFNAVREDHKHESRALAGGKKF